jgi:hypothetical protein
LHLLVAGEHSHFAFHASCLLATVCPAAIYPNYARFALLFFGGRGQHLFSLLLVGVSLLLPLLHGELAHFLGADMGATQAFDELSGMSVRPRGACKHGGFS